MVVARGKRLLRPGAGNTAMPVTKDVDLQRRRAAGLARLGDFMAVSATLGERYTWVVYRAFAPRR